MSTPTDPNAALSNAGSGSNDGGNAGLPLTSGPIGGMESVSGEGGEDPYADNAPLTGAMNKGGDGSSGCCGLKTPHSTALAWFIAFRLGAIVTYLLSELVLGLSAIDAFVLVIVVLAGGFWTTKNVSGRLLVGLRWWNEVREDGTSVWLFESREDNTAVNDTERQLFWIGIYGAPAVWTVLGLFSLLKTNMLYLLLSCIAVALTSANLVGYSRASKDQKAKIKALAGQGAGWFFNRSVANALGGGGANSSSTSNNQTPTAANSTPSAPPAASNDPRVGFAVDDVNQPSLNIGNSNVR